MFWIRSLVRGLIVWMPKEYLKSISFQQIERNQTSELLTLQMQASLAVFGFINDLWFNCAFKLWNHNHFKASVSSFELYSSWRSFVWSNFSSFPLELESGMFHTKHTHTWNWNWILNALWNTLTCTLWLNVSGWFEMAQLAFWMGCARYIVGWEGTFWFNYVLERTL